MFNLHYRCVNNGDGSASVEFHNTKLEAETEEEAEEESWGDSSVDSLILDIQDGKIVRKSLEWNGKKHVTKWVPLEETK